ncbi:MAG TPA: heme exporter protein CcmD [Phenylobacterium sp.]
MTAFLDMGGYWPFVWPAWGFAVLLLAGLYVVSYRRTRQAERRLAQAGAMPRARAATLSRVGEGEA